MRARRIAALGAVVALVMTVAAARAETAPSVRNVLLVGDGSQWATAIPLLKAAGLQLTEVDAPEAALADSAAETRRVLASTDGPTVLIAQGFGGAVASEVGSDPKVSALVYLAATAPEAGEDLAALAARFPNLTEAAEKTKAAAQQIDGAIDAAAWHEKPSFYAVFEKDETIAPELQRFYAARMNAKTIVLDAMESHPREVAGLILEAAGQKPPACGSAGDDGTAACAAPALPRSLMKGCKCTKGSIEDLTKP